MALFKRLISRAVTNIQHANISSAPQNCNFGLLFDIDGVIVRGKQVLPHSPIAFQKLVDKSKGRFRVPTVFVTNSGSTLRRTKADQLSQWLGVKIVEDQVIMAHSPLQMFTQFHNKHVLVTGQGPVRDIADNLGFTNVSTIEDLQEAFPTLDAVDHSRRRMPAPCAFETYYPRIEAVVMFGEPVQWETSLQLIIDVLITGGLPVGVPPTFPYPHLPILTCNMDLQWMAEAQMPRFGHGAFLTCLESLYEKITSHRLLYTALVGKPSEITFRHSEHILQNQALYSIGLKHMVDHLYLVGDNLCTDIYGANLYDRYLQLRHLDYQIGTNRNLDLHDHSSGAEKCFSILVETGVYHQDRKGNTDHSPRDFLPVEEVLQEPDFVVSNVLEAVNLVFEKEKFS